MMKKRNAHIKLLGLAMLGAMPLFFSSCAKKGCTDPSAENYDEEAKKYDGSCTYATIEDEVIIKDDGSGIGDTTWFATKTYILDGFCFVNDGQTLTIEPGTVIKGKSGNGTDASALIVARGGTINAEGTAEAPIIFTFEADPNDGSVGVDTKGQWGGVIVLGSASLNSTPGVTQIEGIPTSEPRGEYGGSNDADNSGTLKYISIRHGGTDIGAGNEINGLTLGGVGSGTTIEYIEVISNQDDGIEFFGGKPNVKYAVVAFGGDDCYDYDEGYRGKGQFWVAIQEDSDGDRGGEHDGGTNPEDGTPYATPLVYNATYIGNDGKRALTMRDNAGGEYHNSIFFNWDKGIDIELLASGEHSWERYKEGSLKFEDNIFQNVADDTPAGIFAVSFGSGASANPDSATADTDFDTYFTTAGNQAADAGLTYSFSSAGIGVIPNTTANGATAPSDSWFESVSYRGAFEPGGTNWLKGWTKIDEAGYLK